MADSVALSALDWWAEAGVDTLAEQNGSATEKIGGYTPAPARPALSTVS